MLEKVWRKWNLSTLLVGIHIGTATMKNSTDVLKKAKNRTNIWSCNPILGHISKENSNLKKYTHPNVHSRIIYNSQDMKATTMPINRGMDKENMVHKYNEILLSHRKEWNNAITATWIDLEIVILNEVRQIKTNTIWYCLYVKSKKVVQMNLFTKQK